MVKSERVVPLQPAADGLDGLWEREVLTDSKDWTKDKKEDSR